MNGPFVFVYFLEERGSGKSYQMLMFRGPNLSFISFSTCIAQRKWQTVLHRTLPEATRSSKSSSNCMWQGLTRRIRSAFRECRGVLSLRCGSPLIRCRNTSACGSKRRCGCVFVCVGVSVGLFVCLSVSVYVCMCVCMCNICAKKHTSIPITWCDWLLHWTILLVFQTITSGNYWTSVLNCF